MTDRNDSFDDLLHDALRNYNRPPDEREMPLDDMWQSIQVQAFPGRSRASRYARYLPVAAALVVGIGIGRVSLVPGRQVVTPPPSTTQVAVAARRMPTGEVPSQSLDPATSRYLGQAAALLIALPTEANVGRPDQPFMKRANELLLTTRLLLDSQSGNDPAMRNLLEDLELVLVQVVRLEKERQPSRRTELELIQQALDQRDVIPRLRSAASEYAADD